MRETALKERLQLSVIVPVYNGLETLGACLAGIENSTHRPAECIVVDDGSTDASGSLAEQRGATVISTKGRFGPAYARNMAARLATGDILVFLDADVKLESTALERFLARFEEDPGCDAVIGSYDESPADQGMVGSFKNFMHHYTHQRGNSTAFSFWCGCGAVRRDVFLSHSGLDEKAYTKPTIEDIEFGLRLIQAGHKILLDPRIQAKHLKRWTLRSLVGTDVLRRAIPWTELILRSGYLPNDLNLRWGQRFSVAIVGLVVLLMLTTTLVPYTFSLIAPISVALLGVVAVLNFHFHRFLAARRGLMFSVTAFPLTLLYLFYSGAALIAGVVLYQLKLLRPGGRVQFQRPRL